VVIPRTSTLSPAAATPSAITAAASIVGAGIVTDTVSASTKSTSAVVIADAIAISVYESGAYAAVITYTTAVGIRVSGTASAVTLTVLGSNNSYGERNQCNDQDSSHCSCLYFAFISFDLSPSGHFSNQWLRIYIIIPELYPNFTRIIPKFIPN
jgi:hypothetical protein